VLGAEIPQAPAGVWLNSTRGPFAIGMGFEVQRIGRRPAPPAADSFLISMKSGISRRCGGAGRPFGSMKCSGYLQIIGGRGSGDRKLSCMAMEAIDRALAILARQNGENI